MIGIIIPIFFVLMGIMLLMFFAIGFIAGAVLIRLFWEDIKELFNKPKL